ncbi:fms-related tyrosine kinase 3 ligand isoform X2 [Elgaria multicarinata webbii]|uniref:fms-related tyrosine kinase 3 ligand isoform X2 n=1 Tax=Elgaria multicarinata webbii TaxID=159646 RepID=UPI002FCD4927
MTWHHGIPESSVVFLLLLLVSSLSEPSDDCIFGYSPFQTTSFSDDFENLKQYLLFDYPVFMPSNLKPDEFCLGLWKLHLINRNLKSMIKVSGSSLKRLIKNITSHTKIIEKCKIDDSCVDFERTNISQFLEPIPSFLKSLADRMEDYGTDGLHGDFRNCTIIQCLSGQSLSVLQTLILLQLPITLCRRMK